MKLLVLTPVCYVTYNDKQQIDRDYQHMKHFLIIKQVNNYKQKGKPFLKIFAKVSRHFAVNGPYSLVVISVLVPTTRFASPEILWASANGIRANNHYFGPVLKVLEREI